MAAELDYLVVDLAALEGVAGHSGCYWQAGRGWTGYRADASRFDLAGAGEEIERMQARALPGQLKRLAAVPVQLLEIEEGFRRMARKRAEARLEEETRELREEAAASHELAVAAAADRGELWEVLASSLRQALEEQSADVRAAFHAGRGGHAWWDTARDALERHRGIRLVGPRIGAPSKA